MVPVTLFNPFPTQKEIPKGNNFWARRVLEESHTTNVWLSVSNFEPSLVFILFHGRRIQLLWTKHVPTQCFQEKSYQSIWREQGLNIPDFIKWFESTRSPYPWGFSRGFITCSILILKCQFNFIIRICCLFPFGRPFWVLITRIWGHSTRCIKSNKDFNTFNIATLSIFSLLSNKWQQEKDLYTKNMHHISSGTFSFMFGH